MKITYLFVTGRIDRLNNIDSFAKEMFYGYDFFAKENTTKIIELHEKQNFVNKIFWFIDRVINKITKLPFNMNSISSIENIKILYQSDHIVISNDRLALSSLPMLIICKLLRKNIQVSFFVMGLFDNRNRNFLQNIFCSLLLRILFRFSTNVFFLGIKEYQIATSKFEKIANKFNYLPFMVDVDFWKASKLDKPKSGILFVGNDSNREFEKIIKLASILKDIEFIIVSKYYRIHNIDIKLSNVKVIDGSWGNQRVSDKELCRLYNESRLVIIPLKESNQPSGQSVTLQSMQVKTPVMITKTSGFWDSDNFKHMENIILIENNSLDNWVRSINEIYYDNTLLKSISNQGFELINKKYSNHLFYEKLSKILKIN